MAKSNLIKQLQERGLVAQTTDEIALSKHLSSGPIVLYCGFDPTADSLHLGHLVVLLCLKRFQLFGHRPIILIGGATGFIGDPSFKVVERKAHTVETIQKWVEQIKRQIALFVDFDCSKNSAIAVNNYDWFHSMKILNFLHDIGKYFYIKQMISKEAIKQRLNYEKKGLSFTEFSYNLLQSYDFLFLNEKYGVTLQIGGSDQWGNIISGINLIRRLHRNTVFGLTVPLITKSDGIKFGKTESGVIWLDPKKTSPYQFYQFWININDNDVYRFLKCFTFIDMSDIMALEEEFKNKNIFKAQYILAEEVTRMVHGEKGLAAAKRITTSLFSGKIINLTQDDFIQLSIDGMPMIMLEDKMNNLQQALVASGLAPSLGQARTMITAHAISINGEKKTSVEYVFNDIDRLYNRYTLLCRGKKNYCLLYWRS
ncbi:tyrosine--tRNA ligase [Candidatus Curculioniphilus buchneri]|uniref:tyrosine--tRNA ligase n=1 Tax=Candidatus Curculioniphilus buchneri TaxID=690594 RepID=UPI00376F3F8F